MPAGLLCQHERPDYSAECSAGAARHQRVDETLQGLSNPHDGRDLPLLASTDSEERPDAPCKRQAFCCFREAQSVGPCALTCVNPPGSSIRISLAPVSISMMNSFAKG